MFKKLLKPLNLLIALLIVIVVFSFAASMVQNSFFSVKVSKISFTTERGELSGYLYTPRGVDADNPAPAVILTHGYLNNAEMQEVGAIELSRRGYVVLAFDMYDHGDSKWDTPAQFAFFIYPVYDAVQYMYDQPYVLKDAAGNGMIGVSGHSMGGFATEYAVVWDEFDFATNGYRKIAASLAVGADFRYIDPSLNAMTLFGPRSSGVIAAQYDQFFFDNTPAVPGETMVHKDYTKDPVGLEFLGRTGLGATAGTFYSRDGGQRVIYTPDETHPQNTWSLKSGKDMFTFFNEAFTYQLGLHSDLGTLESYGINTTATGQTWWLKEAFTLVSLLALIALVFPAFTLLTKLPVFNKVYANGVPEVVNFKPEKSKLKLSIKAAIIALFTLFMAFLIKIFMNREVYVDANPKFSLTTLAAIMWVIFGIAVAAIIAAWVMTQVKKDDESKDFWKNLAVKVSFYGGALVVVSLLFHWLLANATEIIQTGHYYSAPSVNTIVYWAMASGGMILLIVLLSGFYFNYKSDDPNPFGLKVKPIQLAVSLLTAIALVTGMLFIVALVGWVFLTDFRIYTYAIQIFNSWQFVAGLRYIPLFFVYYFAASLTVFVNTKNVKGWLGDLFAAFLLAGPVVVFLIVQYAPLYWFGTAFYPTFSLSSILCVGLIPTLSFAAIIMRRMSLKTGNVWTGVFFTSIFFTLITLANTVVYLLAVA